MWTVLQMTAFVRVVLSWLPRSKSAEALHMLHRLDTSSWGQPEGICPARTAYPSYYYFLRVCVHT